MNRDGLKGRLKGCTHPQTPSSINERHASSVSIEFESSSLKWLSRTPPSSHSLHRLGRDWLQHGLALCSLPKRRPKRIKLRRTLGKQTRPFCLRTPVDLFLIGRRWQKGCEPMPRSALERLVFQDVFKGRVEVLNPCFVSLQKMAVACFVPVDQCNGRCTGVPQASAVFVAAVTYALLDDFAAKAPSPSKATTSAVTDR